MCMYVHTSYILQTSSLIFQVSSGSIELHLEIFLLQIVNLRSENSVVKRWQKKGSLPEELPLGICEALPCLENTHHKSSMEVMLPSSPLNEQEGWDLVSSTWVSVKHARGPQFPSRHGPVLCSLEVGSLERKMAGRMAQFSAVRSQVGLFQSQKDEGTWAEHRVMP